MYFIIPKNSCQRTVLINLHISRNGLKMATILGHLGCSFYGGSSKGKGSHRNPDYSTKLWPFGEFLPFSASREKLVGVQLKDVRNGWAQRSLSDQSPIGAIKHSLGWLWVTTTL